jgi:hypothetical protein
MLLVSTLLGTMYAAAAASILRFVHHSMNATPTQYALVASRKGLLMSFFYVFMVKCMTLSYQNFTGDFSTAVLWWRLGLITYITYIALRLGCLMKKVRVGLHGS